MKFEVGDRVRIKKTSEICIVVSKNDIYEPEYETETVNLLNIETERYLGFFTEDDLELDDSLEQLAVEKFKEELKDKINNILNGRYKPWFEKVNGLKEEILEVLK